MKIKEIIYRCFPIKKITFIFEDGTESIFFNKYAEVLRDRYITKNKKLFSEHDKSH